MRFIVYGAGAVGSVLGACMTLAGSEVILIGRPRHVAAINARGLLLQDQDGEHTVQMQAVDSPRKLTFKNHDVILLSAKSQHTAEILAELKTQADADLPIFCFQNGVRNEEMVAEYFNHVYGVLVDIGARYLGPGQVSHYACRNATMGCYPQGIDSRLQSVSRALEDAGCTVILSTRIMSAKWSKLIVNLCNAMYAITGLSIPEAYRLQESRSYMADIMEEGIRVLEAAGIDYESVPGRGSMRDQIDRLRQPEPIQPWPVPSDFDYYPSTWQDLQLQRGTTETEFLNGEIIALSKRTGVPAPLNELLASLVAEMAANREVPGKYSLAQLRRMNSGEMP